MDIHNSPYETGHRDGKLDKTNGLPRRDLTTMHPDYIEAYCIAYETNWNIPVVKPKYRYEYWTVNVPSDFSTDPEERANQAFAEAEQVSRIYRIPATWRIVRDNGEDIRVCRITRKGSAE